jgi:hypothetical protein
VCNPTPSLDVDLYTREDALFCTSLSSCPHAMVEKTGCLGLEYSDFVLHRVKEIHLVVGISCEGFEEQFMALLIAIAVSRFQKAFGLQFQTSKQR